MLFAKCAIPALAQGEDALALEAIDAAEHHLTHARLALMDNPLPCAECGWTRP